MNTDWHNIIPLNIAKALKLYRAEKTHSRKSLQGVRISTEQGSNIVVLEASDGFGAISINCTLPAATDLDLEAVITRESLDTYIRLKGAHDLEFDEEEKFPSFIDFMRATRDSQEMLVEFDSPTAVMSRLLERVGKAARIIYGPSSGLRVSQEEGEGLSVIKFHCPGDNEPTAEAITDMFLMPMRI